MDNLAECSNLTEESLLQALLTRFYDHKIYTGLGEILVALNPFQTLALYGQDAAHAYCGSAVATKLPSQEAEEDQIADRNQPHIFKVAGQLYSNLVHHGESQACIISGESGAGKTEACKHIVQQLTFINSLRCGPGPIHHVQEISDKLIQMNPLMEAFGNAKTSFNDNSSRFGKYVQLWTDRDNGDCLCGATVDHYLLEKSRVTTQCFSEHNYHIFYFILAGLSHDVIRRFHLHEPNQHCYLRSSPDCRERVESEQCRQGFQEVVASMNSLGIREHTQNYIFRVVGAVLLLGNLEFGDGEVAYCNPTSAKTIDAARALAVDPVLLCKSLVASTNVMKGEVISSPFTPAKAQDCRDAAARAIYSNLFDYIISLVNTNLATLFEARSREMGSIGILDLFGFENCETNSFEQLCINLANEQLQSLFNKKVFELEKAEMIKEGLQAVDVTFEDNSDVIALIAAKPISLLAVLDEQSVFPKATDKICLERFSERFSTHRRFTLSMGTSEFCINHFAGKVTYNVRGFLEKNRDTLAQDIIDLFCNSRFGLLRTLFLNGEAAQQENTAKKASRTKQAPTQPAQHRFRSSFRKQSYQVHRRPSNSVMRKQSTRKNKVTVGTQFRLSLRQLSATLMAAEPVFIRCIRPNLGKKPSCFDSNYVARQIRQTGLVETVRIRREGYSYRPTFAEFLRAYQGIAFPYTDKVAPSLKSCFAILNGAGLTSWHLGKTRVFLKYYHEDHLLKCLTDQNQWAIVLQANWRKVLAQRKLQYLRLEASRERREVRDFCNSILATSESVLCTLLALAAEDEARHRAVQQQLSEPLLLPTVPQAPPVVVRKKTKKDKQATKHTSSVLAWDDTRHVNKRRWPSFKKQPRDPPTLPPPPPPAHQAHAPRFEPTNNALVTSEPVECATPSRHDSPSHSVTSKPHELKRRTSSFFRPKQESPATEVLVEWRRKELARHSGQFESKWGVMFSAWFHGLIPRARAEELVSCKPNGTFLIRVSEKRFGYTCTVKWNGSVQHFLIEQLPGDGRYRVVGSMTTYPDLADFVDYHSCHPLSDSGEVLLHPCGEKAKVSQSEAAKRGLSGAGGYEGRVGWRKPNNSPSCAPFRNGNRTKSAASGRRRGPQQQTGFSRLAFWKTRQ